MAKLGIIIASTRPGRLGLPIGQWTDTQAREHAGFDEIELTDLAELNLPFMDEPNHPRLGQYTHQHTLDWSAKIRGTDAFVFVMPEYNYGYTAPLKNAIDYLHNEWKYKPVGLVSYGGIGGGLRAAQMLKQVLTTLRMTPVFEAVAIPFVHQYIDEEENFVPNDLMITSAKAMFEELARVEAALRPLRTDEGGAN
ncbi:NAD(P)H-dependent oxidoreductase [Actinoallomurus bryophytorum]|uniref:NAD(P)H-dependent FMN reductase n=1 Tax=Actinoallomurus bryophytorum TaxID=1490222 RepID=A0A543C1F0_9ACTN|nr:NAD(P)H-dependent oxidoreductase [Actinoallomurus bryophytorum]TQL90900.1 NAD(P)H-dependent FMN reductase [Actinoallomurus bryophytorum]